MADILRQALEKSLHCLRQQAKSLSQNGPHTARQLSTTPRKKSRKALQSRTGVLAVKKSVTTPEEALLTGAGE